MAKIQRHQVGGDEKAADIVDRVTFPKIKVAAGRDGVEPDAVSAINPLPVVVIDNELAEKMLLELRKMNLHLAMLTDIYINDSEVA